MAGLSPRHPGGFSRQFGEHPHHCDAVYLLHPVLQRPDEGPEKPEARGSRALLRSCEVTEPMTARRASEETLGTWLEWAEPVFEQSHRQLGKAGKRALLMGIYSGDQEAESALEDSLDELSQLARSAGAVVVARIRQARSQPDTNTYIGSGKTEEVAFLIQQEAVAVVITDDELSPAQQRNLERLLRVKVIDRTELILDIFAQRAQSR